MDPNVARRAAGLEEPPESVAIDFGHSEVHESLRPDPLDPTPAQIELSSSSTDLGDFVDKLNETLPHYRAVVAVEYSYGLPGRETRELSWSQQRGKDERLVAELDIVTTGNIPGRPEFGPLSHRLRGVVIHDQTPYAVGAIVADLARHHGLTVKTSAVDEIPF